jgi:hypothetical protein
VAVIASVPAGNAEVVKVAVLVRAPVTVSVAVPSAVDPLMNVTAPVGAVDVPVSVAVNVTGCPYVDGFNDDATEIVGPAVAPVDHV